MTFTNRDKMIELLTHARSAERCVLEFTTNEKGETTVADITNHVETLERRAEQETDGDDDVT